MPNRIDLTDVVFNGDPYGDFDRGEGSFDPNSLSSSTNTPTDSETLITKESGNWVVKTFSKVWDYIKGKIGISSSGSASKYLNEQGTFTTIPEIDEDTTPTTIPYTPAITVDNALGVNAEDVKVKIEPVQAGSGTPNPTNIRPITGWDEVNVTRSGKNLFDKAVMSDITTGYANKTITLKANTNYTISTTLPKNNNNSANLFMYLPGDSPNTSYNGVWSGQSRTVTTGASGEIVIGYRTVYYSDTSSTWYLSHDFQIEKGTTATPYEPYQGNTYTIDLNGTRYGGTLDVTSGELTITHYYIDCGTLTFTRDATTDSNKKRFYAVLSPGAAQSDTSIGITSICSHYIALSGGGTYATDKDGYTITADNKLFFYIDDYSTYTAEQFKAAISGVQLCYTLKTPQTIQLTPTQIKMLQGNNTLFADSGDSQLSYYVNTLGNIGGALSEIVDVTESKAKKSDLASINVTGTANSTGSAIASGTYFYLNGALVKAKVDIANGATFTKNTNYEEVTAGSLNDMNSKMDYMFNIIRGRQLPIIDLGTSYTAELKSDISSGRFEKAIVGGKLTINGHVYYLAHPDYWLHTGDTECTKHHMLVVPAGNLVRGKMNSTNITTGAYARCDLKTGANGNTALADIRSIIKADFGAANILTHREYFANATANGRPSAGAWYDSDIDLMNESMVYGGDIFSPHSDGTNVPAKYTIDKTQIKLFAERPDLITNRAVWWLRDVVSGASFADVASDGFAHYGDASVSRGIRPVFAIC